MREELKLNMSGFLERRIRKACIPQENDEIRNKIIGLAHSVAMVRGTISRDKYNPDLMLSVTVSEVPIRLTKQLIKLAKGIAMYYGKSEVGEEVLPVIAAVARGTIESLREKVCRRIWQANGNMVSTDEISETWKGRIPKVTVWRVLQDLHKIRVVSKKSLGKKHYWKFARKFREHVSFGELWR
jgi:hypothetical protein